MKRIFHKKIGGVGMEYRMKIYEDFEGDIVYTIQRRFCKILWKNVTKVHSREYAKELIKEFREIDQNL